MRSTSAPRRAAPRVTIAASEQDPQRIRGAALRKSSESGNATRADAVDLFSAGVAAGVGADHGDANLTGAALAQARLDRWGPAAAALANPNVGGVVDMTPGLKTMAQRFETWLILPTALADLERAGLREVALYDQIGLAPIETDGRVVGGGLCFGACGQPHVRSSMFAVVDVFHDAHGAPQKWQLSDSSGNSRFDAAALAAIGDAVAFAPKGVLQEGRPVEWSRWRLSMTATQWSRAELLLDPQFEPSGKTLRNELLGRTMLERKVVLIAVRYIDGESVQVARPPSSPM